MSNLEETRKEEGHKRSARDSHISECFVDLKLVISGKNNIGIARRTYRLTGRKKRNSLTEMRDSISVVRRGKGSTNQSVIVRWT